MLIKLNHNNHPMVYEMSSTVNDYDDLLLDGIVDTTNFNNLVCEYIDNYYDTQSTVTEVLVDDLYDIYSNFNDLMDTISEINGSDNEVAPSSYKEKDLLLAGFIKSDFVIHEHDSRKAPLHWDLRFKTEFKTSAYSFVIIKHHMPNKGEKLLCKKQPMHPPVWVDLKDTNIESGYGAGSVTTVDRGTIYYKVLDNEKKIVMYLDGDKYKGAYYLISINQYNYLFFSATNSILPTVEERNEEWQSYAKNYIAYLNNKINKILLSRVDRHRKKIEYSLYNYISRDYQQDYSRSISTDNHMLVIPSIQYVMDSDVKKITSTDCKINSIEDIMRLYLTREYIRKMLSYDLTIEYLHNILETVKEIDYSDPELTKMHKSSNSSDDKDDRGYLFEKAVRAISDIYLGHKYYGAIDLEQLISYSITKHITSNKG